MTDISSIRTHAEPQLTSGAPFSPATPLLPNGLSSLDGSLDDEESSTIKCICGFHDDDGNTVLCEKCNTWQHIACYYESPDVVPDIHECADCVPRPLDVKGATERQRQRIKELTNGMERRVKRPASKSHKKKVKDAAGNPLTNGWPVDKNDPHFADRKSGSPRDGPPSKRPKTSHKSSTSISILNNTPVLAPNGKRAYSNNANGGSPTKSPTSTLSHGYYPDYFSSEFLQLYRKAEPKSMQENSYSELSIMNDMTTWLEDPDVLAEITDGMTPQQIFQRVPGSIEDLDQTAPIIIKNVEEDQNMSSNGLYPVWHYLTVDSPVPEGGYIGELTGVIARKKDYCSSPSNRWQQLRHPEPFVFFPPHLPLAIDARKGGTIMRYARRSCKPNMLMRIFITEGIYHFCFVADREIEPGQELTLPWDVDSDIRRLLGSYLTNGNEKGIRGVDQLSQWVAGVLSNFGGCACNQPKDVCLFERADRRNGAYSADLAVQPHKVSKSKRVKKQQVSPLSTGHATNSRAGSEAVKAVDQDEDNLDTRSVSGSTRSKPESRDMTPMTHVSNDIAVGLGVELSDREKRKLQQQERLFEQLEYDEQHGHKRKKRNSAGSTLNTPSATTSKQLGHSESNGSTTTKMRSLTNGHRSTGRPSNHSMKPPQKPRPVYVDMSTQTDGDSTVDVVANPCFIRRNRVPYFRQLLNRARDERLRLHSPDKLQTNEASDKTDGLPPSDSSRSTQDAAVGQSPPNSVVKLTKSEETLAPPSIPLIIADARNSGNPDDHGDVEMKDADETPAEIEAPGFRKPDPPVVKQEAQSTTGNDSPPQQSTQQPAHPPSTSASPEALTSSRPTNLHVDLPPPEFNASQITSADQTATPGSIVGTMTGQSVAQSPSAIAGPTAPMFSPAVTSAVTPTPMSKRLSLSDYMARRKAQKTEAQAQATHANSPDSTHMTSNDADSTTQEAASKDLEMKDVDAGGASVESPKEEQAVPAPA